MERNKGFYEKFIKRPQDLVLSVIALVILSPIFLVVAIIVRIKLGTPIFFVQKRPGLHEKIFDMYKFRTMTDKKNENGELLPDEIRLTKVGKWLRALSLDELPELWNIIKGDMAIVGPRPLLVSYLDKYDEYQKRRHEVKAGLTGYAQINGRNAISWNEKFELDVTYVDNVSFVGDWKIIFLTIKKVVIREGINSSSNTTMEPFEGNNIKH